jgi:GWxTD domain-containing protein
MRKFGLFLGISLLLTSCFLFRKNSDIIKNLPRTESSNSNETPSTPKTNLVSTKPMSCLQRILEHGDSMKIFLELDIPRLAKVDGRSLIQSDFLFNFGILTNYAARQFDETGSVKPSLEQIIKKNERYYINFNVTKKNSISGVMILDIVDTKSGEKITRDFVIPYTVTKIREQFSLYDRQGSVPLFSNYFLTKDTIQIRASQNIDKSFVVRHFAHEFEPASPPMTTIEKLPSKNLQIDSLFSIQNNQTLQLDKPGLYLIQPDTNQFYGLSFYVVERKYPKLSKIKDLIEPLRYLTTDEELQQLRSAADPKAELDKFWLKLMSGNTKLAKQTIREYFQRVKFANQYFTTYKEGWKTDMGMIFIIYGRPDRIIRNNDAEFWFYSQNANFSEIKFTFARRPNQFTDESYSLIRYREYEQVWYPIIELWREGKIQ